MSVWFGVYFESKSKSLNDRRYQLLQHLPSDSHRIINYRQVSNIRRTLVDNQIVDLSDVEGASPVGAAPTTSSFST